MHTFISVKRLLLANQIVKQWNRQTGYNYCTLLGLPHLEGIKKVSYSYLILWYFIGYWMVQMTTLNLYKKG